MKKEVRKVPQLRFPEFTGDWEQRKLGEYADFFNGDRSARYPSDKDMVAVGIPFINAGDLVNGRVQLDTANKISEEKYNELSGAKIQLGDIIYCLRGTLGKNAFVDNFEVGTVASSLVDIRPKNINGKYLFQVLNSDIEYRQRVVHDEGAAQPNLSAKNLSEFNIPVPETAEQEKIAEFFWNMDYLITLHQRKLEKIKEFKKGMLQKMFPKKGDKVPEIRFKGFTDDWEQRKLENIVEVCSGRDYKHLEAGNIPVYGTGGYMLSVSEALSYDVDAIGIGRKGTIDKPYILKAPFWTVDTLFYCICKEGHNLNFVYDIFQNINWKAMDESTGVPSLSKTTINKVKTLIPSYLEQEKIGKYFSCLDKLITLHQCKIDKFKELKKGLLQQMFV